MHLLQAIVLGIVQGLTEFLPISSSAHLDIVPALLGWPKPGVAFVAVIQLGTMLSVLVYFSRDIRATLVGIGRALRPGGDPRSPEARLFWAVIIGTLPIGVFGLLFKRQIEGPLHDVRIEATMLIVMAIALFLADRLTRKTRPLAEVRLRDGLMVGFAQALALIPGASRSGSTLTGAFLTGLDRAAAVRFSFLLSLPAVLLSGLFQLREIQQSHALVTGWSGLDIAVATLVSGVVGYACIAWLLRFLTGHSALVFVVYRIVLGLLLLYLAQTGRIQA